MRPFSNKIWLTKYDKSKIRSNKNAGQPLNCGEQSEKLLKCKITMHEYGTQTPNYIFQVQQLYQGTMKERNKEITQYLQNT